MIQAISRCGLLAWLLVPSLVLSGCLGGGGGGGGGGGPTNSNQVTTPPSPNTPGTSTTAPPNGSNVTTSSLPHTGIKANQCYESGSSLGVDCAGAGAIALSGEGKQDGMYAAINPMSYSAVGSYSKEECVKDNVTGLIWEGKTASGPRAGSNTYTNYHVAYEGTQAQMDAATNTYGYVAFVNGIALCGYTDWRLPSVEELQTLVDYGVVYAPGPVAPGPKINTTWFPNTRVGAYWTSTPDVANVLSAWYVEFRNGGANTAGRFAVGGGPIEGVRLVHASK